MPDDLMQRLSAARPDTPGGLLAPDPHLLEEILMTETPTARRIVTPLRLSAVAAIAAALVAGLMVLPTKHSAPPALNMRRIVASTSAALSSGRAHVVQSSDTDKLGPMPRHSGAEFVVEFNGDNRSMYGTVDPGDMRDGRDSKFAIANRVVDGQFYLQDGARWVKDTNAANMSGDDIFSVDPRKFVAAVAQAAQFEQVGGERLGGVDTRHLQATKLDGIGDFNLGLGPRGETALTAFELWVDSDDVVRGLLVKTRQDEKTYPLAQTSITKDANGNVHKSLDEATMGEPVIVTITSSYRVDFTDIGQPIAITAPAGAVSVAGKG
jgi:hypothetical protein